MFTSKNEEVKMLMLSNRFWRKTTEKKEQYILKGFSALTAAKNLYTCSLILTFGCARSAS